MYSPLNQPPEPTHRGTLLNRLASPEGGVFDLMVIGGGATGLGIAVDAAARGLSVALVDAEDFAKGTSSRATKLLHGGVRYLAQGNIALVREALRERTYLLHNAPHLAAPLPFIMPSYRCWETPFYGAGLYAYAALAGHANLGPTRLLDRTALRQLAPDVKSDGLRGGVQYWDAQFDDARLALALARTAASLGGVLLNYCRVQAILHDQAGHACGAVIQEHESGAQIAVHARCLINATGVWVDQVRALDDDAAGRPSSPTVAPSQGTHVVMDSTFWSADNALLIPRTRDGRVLFAIPWLGKVILGTTDQARHDMPLEPTPSSQEIRFILDEAGGYLARKPRLEDIRSTWSGLRPLVRPTAGHGSASTRSISREHAIQVSHSGMVTMTGGKWTTYRAMAEDVILYCQRHGLLPGGLPRCRTASLRLAGAPATSGNTSPGNRPEHLPAGLRAYGTDSAFLAALPGRGCPLDADRSGSTLHGMPTEAMVRFAARFEYARTVEDILARRTRLLFLDARLALALAPRVAAIMQEETGREPDLQGFTTLAAQYLPTHC